MGFIATAAILVFIVLCFIIFMFLVMVFEDFFVGAAMTLFALMIIALSMNPLRKFFKKKDRE